MLAEIDRTRGNMRKDRNWSMRIRRKEKETRQNTSTVDVLEKDEKRKRIRKAI